MNPERLRLESQLDQIDRDIAELADQHAEGEIDDETYGRLDAAYRLERERTAEALAALEAEGPDAPPRPEERRSRRRLVVGGVILGVGLLVISVLAVRSLQNRPSAGLNGVAGEVAATGGRELSTVSNEELEAVIAANPDVIGMRMALARRYFEEGTFDKALEHYMVVLQKEPNAEALANVGWMTFVSGRADIAETFEERALELDADYVPAYWFLANIRLYGLDDPAGAVDPLRRLLATDGIPDDVRTQALTMLDEAGG